MNQLVGKKPDGTPFLVLALEPGNIQRLQERRPIVLHVEDLFPDGIPKRLELAIWYSETPVEDAKALREHAEVVVDERSAMNEQRRPHCPECRSTLEQLGVMRSEESPFLLLFCSACGCTLGVLPKASVAL